MKTNYNKTLQACFVGYVVQAIVNNFVPLLFLTFQSSYGISLQICRNTDKYKLQAVLHTM